MGEELDAEEIMDAVRKQQKANSVNSILKSDFIALTRKMHKVQQIGLDYVNRNNGDDFMLRVELLDLQKYLNDVIKRSEKPT